MRSRLAQTWLNVQGSLFLWLAEKLGELTQKQQELVTTLELIRIEEFILSSLGYSGCPTKDRREVARAFVAKAVYNKERSTVERVNDRLKDEFGGRVVRVCGPVKVMCHLIFGILALTANQVMCFLE